MKSSSRHSPDTLRHRTALAVKKSARPIVKSSARILIRRGRFILIPVKKSYEFYLRTVPQLTYSSWARQNEDKCFAASMASSTGPLISVVVPVYNPEHRHLLEMVYSVVNQHYEQWELILVNGSDDPTSREQVRECQNVDTRIRIVDLTKNLGIADNTNKGLDVCKGEYIAFFDHDDLLHPCALHSAVATIERSGAGLVYTDEDKVRDDSSAFFDPLFKPKWSPDLFRNVNYINHLTIVKREYVKKVNGLRSTYNGAQDYDFLLRVIDMCKPKINHVPHVLYHWRAAKASTASNFGVKDYVLRSGTMALQEHLKRAHIKGVVKPITNRPGFYETTFPVPKVVSLVVGPVDQSNHRLCAAWLEKLTTELEGAVKLELIIGDWFKPYRAKVITHAIHLLPEQKKYWQTAATQVSSGVVVCFTDAALPLNDEAFVKLAAAATEGPVIVSPMLTGEGGTIVDAGLVESEYGKQRLFRGYKFGDNTYYGSTEWVRNVAGLTLGVYATSTELFKQLCANTRDMPDDTTLQKTIDTTVRLIIYPHATFIYKGSLATSSFINDTFFNPQLAQAYQSIDIRMSSWTKLEEMSERASE